jgi:hypothetical protein
MPLTKHDLCEEKGPGDYAIEPVKKNCSDVYPKEEMNVGVCDDPSLPQDCGDVPKGATMHLEEEHYNGKITASEVTADLPAKIRKSSWFRAGLCGDRHKSPSEDAHDKIKLVPHHGEDSPAYFVIYDEGPQFKNGSGSSACQVVFYDDADRFVQTLVVMTTP